MPARCRLKFWAAKKRRSDWILVTALDAERQPGTERGWLSLQQGGGGGRGGGGEEEAHRCGGSAGGPPRPTHHYCFNGALRVKLTLTCREHTHTHTRSLTHTWCNAHYKTGRLMHAEALQHKVYCWSWECEQKDRRSSKTTFHSHLRRWVFIPLVCTEIYKTLTPANPAATKTGRGQKGNRKVLPKHTNRANYKTVVLFTPMWLSTVDTTWLLKWSRQLHETMNLTLKFLFYVKPRLMQHTSKHTYSRIWSLKKSHSRTLRK